MIDYVPWYLGNGGDHSFLFGWFPSHSILVFLATEIHFVARLQRMNKCFILDGSMSIVDRLKGTAMSTEFDRYRALFPVTERFAFLSHAAISPLNTRLTAAVQTELEQAQQLPFTLYYPRMLAIFKTMRDRIATLINARSVEELVMMPNTAAGLNTAAQSLPLSAGDNILVLDGDYPANIYPWLNLASKGVFTKFVPQKQGGLDIAALEARIDRRTRVIALSTVMFATGFRNDIEAVGKLCRAHGIYFVVDGIQSLGAIPMDVQAYNIDFLACGSQKWLLSAPGAGFLYCREEILDDLVAGAYVGASSVVDANNYLDYNFTFPHSAERFNLGTPNVMGATALNAALGMLLEVGIEKIQRRIEILVDTLINDLTERGYNLAASTEAAHRSGIVVAQVPDPPIALHRLQDAGIIATLRGSGVRFAPHFYNTTEEVMRVGEVLGDA